jgi:broad specificity phosphatase PhoE
MRRHRETVAGICEGTGQAAWPDTDASWNEFDFDRIVGAYLEQHPDDRPDAGAPAGDFGRLLRRALSAWSEDRLTVALPERWPEFEARVERGLRTLTDGAGDRQRILLVSSGGPIAMALRQVLQAPASAMVHMNLQLRNSSYSHLYFNARGMHFAGFNHVPHLDHPERADSVTHY